MKTICILGVVYFLGGCTFSDQSNYDSWTEYLGGPDRNHYSTLSQIDTNNVAHLEIEWIYETPDSGQMQMNPVMINGVVYGVTAALKAFALDAATGKELWLYKDSASTSGTCRGVAYWEDGNDKRIFYTVGANLLALNAMDGKLIPTFGNNGKVNLHTGLPDQAKDKYITSTTPGTIFKNLIIMPVRVDENAGAAPGHIRAFDVRTGKLIWTFHTIPQPGEKGYETWPKEAYKNINVGAVNNWAGMALDKKTGILFIPLGSAAPDFYGANRKGPNLFANCLLALNADDGTYKWHFQMIHHDLWDRDLPAPPNLIVVTKNGKHVDAVAQVTKQGYVYVFDRKTGESMFPINEIAAPVSSLPGEQAWSSQPVPSLPKPFAREAFLLTENDVSPFATNKEELKHLLTSSDKRLFAPPDTNNVLLLPGYDGGAEYGGAAADPFNGILYVNANEMAWFLRMERHNESLHPGKPNQQISAGEQIYSIYCSSCHGEDKRGIASSGYPDLSNIAQKQAQQYVLQIINNGKGMMPGFPNITKEDKRRLVEYLYGVEKKEAVSADLSIIPQDLYKFTGYTKFLDEKGLPAITPPWGTLTSIDLNTGKHIWQTTLGITPGLPNQETNPTGCENYGGPIVTENGLLLIAGTKDGMFRAFNKYTGKLLWQTKLPAASFATPAMYSVNGKQYIVMACGGEKLGTPKGNTIVAFALK
ncbi:MAG TPA: pyrrolo-quinoline quinone [Prolixibacteraceae bacterium]|nr:pyrrolo-quinoline quinone [Prolixibacteraceae bacterium]